MVRCTPAILFTEIWDQGVRLVQQRVKSSNLQHVVRCWLPFQNKLLQYCGYQNDILELALLTSNHESQQCFTSPFLFGPGALLLCILKHKMSRTRIFEYCVVGVLCRSLFVSDHFRLSAPISPASECKAICGSCQRIWVWPLNEVPTPCALELRSEPPPTSFAEAPPSVFVCASFLSPMVSQVKLP